MLQMQFPCFSFLPAWCIYISVCSLPVTRALDGTPEQGWLGILTFARPGKGHPHYVRTAMALAIENGHQWMENRAGGGCRMLVQRANSERSACS